MSVVEGMPAILLPAEPGFRESRDRDARFGRLRRTAIVAAALAHTAVIVALLIHWPTLPAVAPPARPIAVTLVTAPPPAPPPPKARPTPMRATPHELVSGPDTKTTAPPQAAEQDLAAAPKPVAPPRVEVPSKTALPEPKPSPVLAPHLPKPKLATRETAPKKSARWVDRAPGKEHEGDPYLNRLQEMVEEQRFYPANAIGPLGLRLEGTAVFSILIGANGALLGVQLDRSTGAEVLDRAALAMIRKAAPFPPPPSYLLPPVVIEAPIHISPNGD
ncbi:MAG TPA: TonB family protein [Stellaceae bacterium]|nr:TonB family protein [Stellaceae bacterium]